MAQEAAQDDMEADVCEEMRNNAREFENLALDLLDYCYRSDVHITLQLLTYELQNWSKHTCLGIAVAAKHSAFLAHTASQMLVADLWMGGLRTRKHTNLKTLRRLRTVILTSGAVLIHENARPHNAVVTQKLLEQFKWDVSYHPAYSPDLATSDFHLLPELKNCQGSQTFQKNEEIQSKVKDNLTSLVGTFFEQGIRNLVHRYDKCLNLHGDYVEK
ncbi:Transient receptor potential cation channel subfamily M member 1 [Araneus ventricosus]|uniref:Transient receptor potential cation channel subfamily M member 1 n=1 Tax=Araneus ventricosus TaxID=182803 RepID=A0A4Y2BIV9_ARAVE|nr:Transient receptor potential cation channel subfamily M member 1 [Araneus ventricosus]